jgi:hypothetical protein
MKSFSCGAGAPARESLKPAMAKARSRSILAAVISSVAHSLAMLVAALREIFDESAYQRFLDRSQLQSSPSSYAMFQQETEQARSRRPRCC